MSHYPEFTEKQGTEKQNALPPQEAVPKSSMEGVMDDYQASGYQAANSTVQAVSKGGEALTKIFDLLRQNGRMEEAQKLNELLASVDQLEQTIEQLEHTAEDYNQTASMQSIETEQQMADVQSKLQDPEWMKDVIKEAMQEVMDANRFSARVGRSVSNTMDRLKERCQALREGLKELKNGIMDSIHGILAEFRFKGRKALNGISETLDVSGKLNWMKECIDNGSYELSKSLSRVEDTLQEVDNIKSRMNQMTEQSQIGFGAKSVQTNLSLISDRYKVQQSILSFANGILSKAGQLLERQIASMEQTTERQHPKLEAEAEMEIEME